MSLYSSSYLALILRDRAFQSAAPYLWNALPSVIHNMKTLDTFKTAVR